MSTASSVRPAALGAEREPVRFVEMTLQRVGDNDAPASGAIPRQ